MLEPQRISTIGRKVVVGLLALAPVIGCSERDRSVAPREVWDSAGVRMVRYAALPESESGLVRLAVRPRLVIGGDGAAPRTEFSEVAGVLRLSDGRLAVADGGSSKIRFFNDGGVLVGEAGGFGDGPGEFRNLSFIGLLPGDSILTYDSSLRRLQVFDPQGRLAWGGQLTSDSPGNLVRIAVLGVLEDRKILASQTASPTDATVNGPERLPELLVSFDWRAGTWDTLDVVRGPSQIIRATGGGYSMQGVPFGGHTDAASAKEIVAVVDSDLLGARVIRGGSLQTIIRIEQPAVPVTRDVLEDYVTRSLALWPSGSSSASREQFRQRILNGPHGSSIPQVTSVEVDCTGRIWVNLGREPGRAQETFVVLSPEGDWVGKITFPPGLDRGTTGPDGPGMAICSDYVVGVWRDDLGVETIRVYALMEIGK
jgi:hypothetical protein